ncbi:histidine kinase [Tropicimonas sediminicola]|uniref:Uncharacterized protein n=1 Tax=Tropicimonas sediminicola TaxID=1031541 RepID=A0A239LMB3_9RHOB|nr:histidine kinase [Tropicimonas sediminicola]SNT31817.1 hypothetical protein SAMN05421757_110128 [Tropicimonas sediminicola]
MNKHDIDANAPVPTADQLRMELIERKLAEMEKRETQKAAERQKLAAFTDDFMKNHVSDKEREMIRRLVQNAVSDGKWEALVYSFPSDLCTDSGRAITNGEPDWPKTLQGKAKELYERYQTIAKPAGYRLKAMIINYPGGMPGDVGLFLSWAPEA